MFVEPLMTLELPSGSPALTRCRTNAQDTAALMLVESLMHMMIARGALSLDDAIEAVDDAAMIASELEDELSGRETTEGYLRVIALSLRSDAYSKSQKN